MWIVLALLASWLYCAALEINKHYPYEGVRIVVWRSLVAVVAMLGLTPFMHWPSDPTYYYVIFGSSAVWVWGMKVQYNLAAEFNGRVANLHQPITIVITFLAWFLVDTAELNRFLTDYVYAAGVLASLVLMIMSLQFIRKNDASWAVFMRVAPVGVVYAAILVLAKLYLDTDVSAFKISLNWVFLGNLGLFVFGGLAVLFKHGLNPEALMPKGILKASVWGSGLHNISWVFAVLAVIFAANPAYPSIIAALAPLWFALYYTARGIKDEFSPIAGLFLGLSAVLLTLVTL